MRCLFACVRLFVLAATLVAIPCPLAKAGTQSNELDKKQILNKARRKYYNLKQAGLIDFQVNVKPNWHVVADFQSNPAVLKVLEDLQFSMSIDAESKLRVDHQTELIPTNQKTADYIDKVFKDMNDALSRFISAWSVFMLGSPFPPEDSSYEINEIADRYQFSRWEGATNVVTLTDKAFKIIEINVSGSTFKASLKPLLKETADGFILSGYSANHETGSRNTRVEARVEYEVVKRLQLPRKVNVNTVYEGKPAEIEWLFSDYQVRVR